MPDQHDYLLDVRRGRCYGHPDPARCEWVLDGIFDFGLHTSPHRIIEYGRGIASYARGIPAHDRPREPARPRREPSTGFIYVSELGARGIALLRPAS